MLVILAAGALFGSISVAYPFGRDQGIYAYAGKMLLLGKVDFKYVFDVKPPGVHYLFGLEQFMLGESMLNMRLFDILWESATAFVIFLIAARVSGSFKASLLTSILYLFLYYRLDYWHTLQADGFLNLPFALSILMMLKTKEELSVIKPFAAGILFALVILFKYTLAVFIPFAFAAFLLLKNISMKRKIAAILMYSAGIGLVIAITCAFYFFNDAFDQFKDVQLVQIPLYANIGFDTENHEFIIKNVTRLFVGSVYSPLILFGVISLVYYILKKEFNYNKLLIFFWAVTSIASLIAQWKFFYYHFLVIIPPLSIFAAMFFSLLLQIKKRAVAIVSISVIYAVYLLFGSKPYGLNYSNLGDLTAGKKSLSQLYIENGTTTDSVFMMGKTFRAVDYVESRTNPTDKIYVWGFDPLVYYLSGRLSSSRFIYNFPLCWKGNNTAFRKEFIAELNMNTPKLILVQEKDPLPFISGYKEDSKQLVDRFPEFKQMIEQSYDYKAHIDDFYYYELKKEKQN